METFRDSPKQEVNIQAQLVLKVQTMWSNNVYMILIKQVLFLVFCWFPFSLHSPQPTQADGPPNLTLVLLQVLLPPCVVVVSLW